MARAERGGLHLLIDAHQNLASYPGPIPSFSMLHVSRAYVEKIGEPGDEATKTVIRLHYRIIR